MNTDFIKGVVVPILTPIDADERIDEARLRAQVDYVIDGGVSGILAFGSNGEFYMVEEDEMERGLKLMVDQAAGRVPVYFGIGAISTRKCCRLAQMAAANGAAGISVLQPMFLKPTYAELLRHFKTIAESVPGVPMLLYNNPGRVGYTLTADLVDELAHTVDNIVGMKDTSGDITLTSEFIRRTRDVDFKVFGGKDTLLYASLCHGAVGGVCTAANFMPELITDVYNKFAAGDLKGSLEAQFKLNPVRLSMDAASFPVAAKDMANLRGREQVTFRGRAIPFSQVLNAMTLTLVVLFVFLIASMVISTVEGLPYLNCAYEVASAMGTVGLTTGITPELTRISQSILIVLMYLGRVGILSFSIALMTGKRRPAKLRYPEINVMIG